MSIAEVDLIKLSALTDSIDASLAAATEALSSVDVDPNYISYTIGTLPDSTGAVNGTIGSYFTSDGLLQKLEWDGTAWVTIGQQISSKNYVDDKASLFIENTTRPLCTTEDTVVNVPADYATIQEAILQIPLILHHKYTINVDDGVYSEHLKVPQIIMGFAGNAGFNDDAELDPAGFPLKLTIIGNRITPANVEAKSIVVSSVNGGIMEVRGFTFTEENIESGAEKGPIFVQNSDEVSFVKNRIRSSSGVMTFGVVSYNSVVQVAQIDFGIDQVVDAYLTKHTGIIREQKFFDITSEGQCTGIPFKNSDEAGEIYFYSEKSTLTTSANMHKLSGDLKYSKGILYDGSRKQIIDGYKYNKDELFVLEFKGTTADERLDNLLAYITELNKDGFTVYLQQSEYLSDRTISNQITFKNQNNSRDFGAIITGTWTVDINASSSVFEYVKINGVLDVQGNGVKVLHENGNGAINVSGTYFQYLFSNQSNTTVTFGVASTGCIAIGTGIDVVDNGDGNTKILETRGSKSIFSGDGNTTTFTIPHGLPGSPRTYSVTPETANAGFYNFWVTADSTNLTIRYTTAPVNGTDNLIFRWEARK